MEQMTSGGGKEALLFSRVKASTAIATATECTLKGPTGQAKPPLRICDRPTSVLGSTKRGGRSRELRVPLCTQSQMEKGSWLTPLAAPEQYATDVPFDFDGDAYAQNNATLILANPANSERYNLRSYCHERIFGKRFRRSYTVG